MQISPTDELEPVWRALANPLRRNILDALRRGPRTTGDLAREFPQLSRFAIMQHLGVLEEGELIVWQEILGLLKTELETGDIPFKTKLVYGMMGMMMFMLPKSTRTEEVERAGW